jgi:hypothetical protein
VLLLLALANPTLGAGALHNFLPTLLYPPGTMRNPSACSFNGPQDIPSLRGQNFIENYGTGSCFTTKRSSSPPNNGNNGNLAIEMGVCSWK